MATLQTFIGNADPNLVRLADEKADIYGIPRDIFRALISKESSWNATAQPRKPDGTLASSAYGLTQLTKAAAQDVGANVLDPEDNLRGGAEYLSRQYKATGDWNLALQRYYGGPSGYKTDPYAKTYAQNIMQLANTSGGSTAMGSSGTNPMDDVMYDQMGNVISSGNEPDKTDMSKTDSGGIAGFVKNQMGNVSFIILGIVIIAIAILATNKGKAIVVQAAATAGAA